MNLNDNSILKYNSKKEFFLKRLFNKVKLNIQEELKETLSEKKISPQFYENYKAELSKRVLVTMTWMAPPLVISFSLVDKLVIPEKAYLLFFVRTFAMFSVLTFFYVLRKIFKYEKYFHIYGTIGFPCSLGILNTYLAYAAGGIYSVYYMGINLVCMGVSFLNASRALYLWTLFFIYLPYYLCAILLDNSYNKLLAPAIHAFTLSIIFLGCIITHIFAKYRYKIYLQEEQLQKQIEQLKSAQMKIIQGSQFAELGRMSASLAHEINSPLIGIRGCVNGIKNLIKDGKLAEEKINTLQAYTNLLEKGTKFIADVVKNISNSAGDPDACSTIEFVKELVDIALGVTGFSFKGKAIILNEVSPDLKVRVQKVMAIRCIMNLITNAVYAMVNAKTKGPQIKIRSEVKNDQVQIIVQDNGPGIPKQIQENIFKPFNTNKPVGEGNGLGLSMVKNMMEEMDGHVDYRTSEQGTEFILTFPC